MIREVLLPLQEQRIIDKALVRGDFRFASGSRADAQFDLDRLAGDSLEFSLVVNGMTTLVQERFDNPDVVVSVANGGTRLGEKVAEELEVPHISTNKSEGTFSINDDVSGANVVILDDIYTRGYSLSKVANVAHDAGAHIVGSAVVFDRSNYSVATFKYSNKTAPVERLLRYYIPIFPAE